MQVPLNCDVCKELQFKLYRFVIAMCSEYAKSSLNTRCSVMLVQKFNLNYTCFVLLRVLNTHEGHETPGIVLCLYRSFV
jgi:hypothetical protein